MDAVPHAQYQRVPSRIRVAGDDAQVWLRCWYIATDTIHRVFMRAPTTFEGYRGRSAQIDLLRRYRSRCVQEQNRLIDEEIRRIENVQP